MEHRYNSNKVLEYKRTPSKTKKRTLNDSANSSFVNTNKRGSKYNLRDPVYNYSKEQIGSGRGSKSKKYDKRSMSSGIRKARELYIGDDTKSSLINSSSKKDRSNGRKSDDSTKKQQKGKPTPYSTCGSNFYFRQSSSSNGLKVLKQKNIVKKHVDQSFPSNSFQYQVQSDMFSPSSSSKILNSSALSRKSAKQSSKLNNSRRMNCFKAPSHKSRDQSHYRMNSSSNKMSDNRSSSVVHPSDLTPLHSNCIKTVKTKNTNEDTLVGSNAYKISTMENSVKKAVKKSLNLSSNQYHEYPTTTDWHSSLVNHHEENIEEMHYFFVALKQKEKRLIERLENITHNPQVDKKSKKKSGSKRSTSAKRRRGDLAEPVSNYHEGVKYYSQKNSNIELCADDVTLSVNGVI